MSHETLDLIRHRVSINRFDPSRPVSDAEIRELVAYASEAPSSFNFQNWRFIAVRDSATKAQLTSLAWGQAKVTEASVTFIIIGLLNPHTRLAAALAPSLAAGILDQATVDAWLGMANGL